STHFVTITGHIGLNQYLHQFNIVEEPTCPRCNKELETVSHYLLRCPAYTRAQERLRRRMGGREIQIRDLVMMRKGIRWTCEFTNDTQRLKEVFGTIPLLPQEMKGRKEASEREASG
ncbi:hypothetical protein L218DRAFT_1067399, partial [Marasmius fiardii PR-910]